MVCIIPQSAAQPSGPLIRHVVRTPDVYLIPRSDGRILLGATVEEAGFDKQTNPHTIKKLFDSAMNIAPILSTTRIHDAWAGLRPASPDNLPILGETIIPGYFAATGHFRDGIMLAPVTARLMIQLITGARPQFDVTPFSPMRFVEQASPQTNRV
jgi:glycine oxidase